MIMQGSRCFWKLIKRTTTNYFPHYYGPWIFRKNFSVNLGICVGLPIFFFQDSSNNEVFFSGMVSWKKSNSPLQQQKYAIRQHESIRNMNNTIVWLKYSKIYLTKLPFLSHQNIYLTPYLYINVNFGVCTEVFIKINPLWNLYPDFIDNERYGKIFGFFLITQKI